MRLNRIFNDGGEILQPILKALHRLVFLRALMEGFGLGSFGTNGGRDRRGARCPVLFIIKQHGCQGLPHMSLGIVGQHGQEHMCAYALR